MTIELHSEAQVRLELSGIIDIQRTNAISRITSFLNYLRATIQGNYLVTGLGTNWLTEIVYLDGIIEGTAGKSVVYPTFPLYYLFCSSSSLLIAATLPPLSSSSISYSRRIQMKALPNSTIVKGFYTGCTPLEALLQSTLDCLYETECLLFLTNYFPDLNQVCRG